MSAAPIAVALVIGVGAFAALLPLLMAEIPERRRAQPERATAPVRPPSPAPTRSPPAEWIPAAPAAAPVAHPRPSRVRVAVTVGALVAWSVWSVRRPRHPGRHL